jgi:predicted DNA-binding antitoxin AbrB/MazE fold protein
MTKTIKAKYHKGMIEPMEKLDIEEGKELVVIITDTKNDDNDPLDATFGGWNKLINAEDLKKNIYADRSISTRQKVEL